MSAGGTPGAAATSLPGVRPANGDYWRGPPLMRPSFTAITAKQGSSIAPACTLACCASVPLQQPAIDSLSRLSHMAGALVHSHCSLWCAAILQLVMCSIQSTLRHVMCCCNTHAVVLVWTLLLMLLLRSMCCELQPECCVVPLQAAATLSSGQTWHVS